MSETEEKGEDTRFDSVVNWLKNCLPFVAVLVVGLFITKASEVKEAWEKLFPERAEVRPQTAFEAYYPPPSKRVYKYYVWRNNEKVLFHFYYDKGEFIWAEGGKWEKAFKGDVLTIGGWRSCEGCNYVVRPLLSEKFFQIEGEKSLKPEKPIAPESSDTAYVPLPLVVRPRSSTTFTIEGENGFAIEITYKELIEGK